MKKIIYSLALLPALLLSSCAKEELVFDHEKPAFETKDGKILLEVIVPSSTKADDEIYIAGEFNGGDAVAAASSQWCLEHSDLIPAKWGIYLDPTTFVAGKTLADGYHFVSKNEREEVTALGDQVVRTLNPAVGTRTNMYVTKWASFYDVVEEAPVHDGYVVYLEDKQGWDATALYIWGTTEIMGGWPGKLPDGTEKIDGKTYKYWDLGWANFGNTCNFIFNNNNGGQQIEGFDCLKGQVADRNYFFRIEGDEAVALEVAQTNHLYILNRSDWTSIATYYWGDVNDLSGGWPGCTANSTIEILGVKTFVFDIDPSWIGKAENLILNNNNGGEQTADIPITFEAKDYFVLLNSKSDAKLITDFSALNEPGGEEPGGDDPIVAKNTYKVYVEDNSGWGILNLYSWGGTPNVEAFGGWPGAAGEIVEIEGKSWRVYTTIEVEEGSEYNFIFNNKVGDEGEQYDSIKGTWSGDIYLSVTATEATVIQ